ncbi:MAG TPA: type VI secretion system baseplate subunit TssE [Bryobacteraceae bacterium]|nr:type VI secretion system baseplate subunit TssE [Bryobacteraceae bacterium]
MAARSERSAKLSVLDRLIDNEPKRTSEAPASPAQSLRELKASLRRDIEWLLNTRRCIQEPPPGASELERSLHTYGLPDICSLSLTTGHDYQRLARAMEATLAGFEPRLKTIRVTPAPARDTASRVLRFQIDGVLRVEPVPEHLTFDTVLELTSGEYEVKGEPSAG